MSIKEGESFEVGMNNFKRQKTQENEGWGNNSGWNGSGQNADDAEAEPKMFQEYIILEREGAVDQVTVHYADIASLQMLGIISLDNYLHLSMIPPSLLTDASYVIRVFKTILIHNKGKLYYR